MGNRQDEVTLSHAVSRGVEGMQPQEVQSALQNAVTDKVQELHAKAEAMLAESKSRFPIGSRVDARWADSYQRRIQPARVVNYYVWRGPKGKSRQPKTSTKGVCNAGLR